MKRFITTVIFIVGMVVSASAQIDNLFWFAAPDITSGHAHNPMTFCFTSFANPATVTISQPANPGFTPVTVTLNPYSYYALDVTAQENIVETAPHNTVCNYGFQIVSTEKITAFYQLGANNSEIYTLKGQNALGTDFVVPMQNYLTTGSFNPPAYSSIEIVATEDNTQVTIIPSRPLLGGAPANVPINITLDRGQTYCIKSVDQQASNHLTNTRITSTKPIAVNSSDDSAASNSFSGYSGQDLVGEQIVPVELAGTTYIALWNNRAFEGVTISPIYDSTFVYINGSNNPVTMLNVGQSYTYMLNQSPTIATLINTSRPAFAFQLTGSDGECGGTVLPALGCTGSEEVVYARPSYSTHLKLFVITHTTDIAGFVVNNSNTLLTAADFTVMPYDPTYSYCYKDFTSIIPTQTVLKISNSLGLFHLGILDYYSGMSSSLGFFSGYNDSGTIDLLMKDKYCLGDRVEFSCTTRDIDTLKLVTPSGDTLYNDPFVIPAVTLADTGLYYLYGHSTAGCKNTWPYDSIQIQVVAAPKPDLGPDRFYCHGEMIELSANYNEPNATFFWNTGETDSSILVLAEGDYILQVFVSQDGLEGVCENADTVHVTFHEQPRVEFSAEPLSGCAPLRVFFQNQTEPASEANNYSWTIWNANGEAVYQTLEPNPIINIEDPGTYTVMLHAINEHGCRDSITKYEFIQSYLQPEVDFTFDPEVVFLSEGGGEVNFTSYYADEISGADELTFTWDFGDGTTTEGEINPSHTYTTWGDYIATLTVGSANGCSDSISHIVVVEDELIFPNVITPNGDGFNDVFFIGNLDPNVNLEDPDGYRTNQLFIYDRWGKKVFEARNYNSYSKDGQTFVGDNPFTGDNLPDGVYYYAFYYKGHYKETRYNGSITIIRQH